MIPTTQQTPRSLLALLRDLRVLRMIIQLAFLIAALWLIATLIGNVRAEQARAGVPVDFDFLDNTSNFNIDEGFVDQPHRRTDPYINAFVVGLGNTLRVCGFGLILTTILGLVVGVARLSSNWLVRNLARGYIEIMQNTPLLVQLFFVYSGVVLSLPPLKDRIELPGPTYLSVLGMAMPALTPTDASGLWFALAVAGFLGGMWLWRRLRRQRIDTGRPVPAAEVGMLVIFGVAITSWAILSATGNVPFTISLPRAGRFSYERNAGAILSPEFFALLLGLVIYTGAFIAECVRSGIQAVPHGQTEAARAQGFTYFQTMRLIVLPQALRVIIPPLTNQYLNLIKNSSLGAAVGYAELFGVARTIQQSVSVIPVFVITMGLYLVLSLITAFLMNSLNRRAQFKTR